MIPVTPFCISRRSDAAIFARIHDLMDHPIVCAAGVVAFARRFHTQHDQHAPKGCLMALMTPRQEEVARWQTITDDHPHHHILQTLWDDAKLGLAFQGELPYISNTTAWIYADRACVVLQAEDIVQEIRSPIPASVARVENLTATRCSCATLRYLTPASAHALLRTTAHARLALERLSSLTKPALDALETHGYHVATPSHEDLRTGISIS